MAFSYTYVNHRDPNHPEAIHPTRNIGNAHVVAGEFFASKYHDALQTVLHPLGESLPTDELHALNDLGIVHADGDLNKLSPIVRRYVRLDDYWTRTHGSELNELFEDRRAHVIGCCTRTHLSRFSRRSLQVETGRTGADFDATLSLLIDVGFLTEEHGEGRTDYTVEEHHPLYRYCGPLFNALLDQALVLCDLLPPTEY